MNAHNVPWALRRLEQTLADVQAGLGDEDAADGPLCESLLERRCGMGYPR